MTDLVMMKHQLHVLAMQLLVERAQVCRPSSSVSGTYMNHKRSVINEQSLIAIVLHLPFPARSIVPRVKRKKDIAV